MSNLRPDRPHRKVRAASSVRPVRPSRLMPVADPSRVRSDRPADPDELPPPCPKCKSAAACIWCIDRRTTRAQVVCLECEAYTRTPAGTRGGRTL